MKLAKGYLLVLATAIISGFAIFINQFAVKGFNPYVFTGLKNLATAFFLTSLILIAGDWRKLKHLKVKYWGLLVTIGLVGGSIPFLLFFKGLALTTGAHAAFIHKTMFLYVAVLAVFFLKERLNKYFILGALCLLIGNLVFLKKLRPEINQGDFLVFIATLFWALENTISKYTLKELSGRMVAWGRMFFGSLFILLFLFATGQVSSIWTLNFQQSLS
jgi:drug/metabolite transporter (DMT)-like permease